LTSNFLTVHIVSMQVVSGCHITTKFEYILTICLLFIAYIVAGSYYRWWPWPYCESHLLCSTYVL